MRHASPRRRVAASALAALWLLPACAPRVLPEQASLEPQPAQPADAREWAARTLTHLTLEEKVGQLLMTRSFGHFESVGSANFQRLEREVRELGVGGLAVSLGSPPEIALKLNALQRRSKIPLLVAADLEYGPGMRLWAPTYLPYLFQGGGGTVLPLNMGVAATGDPALAEEAGRLTAREARAVGIHWLFGPVLDVNTEPANPIVNVRAFSSDAGTAARFGEAWIRGAQAEGALTAAKHFPGHGDAAVDSHVELPVLPLARERLEAVELAPFRAAVAAGAAGVMTGHLAFPALTGGEPVPASLSGDIVTGILRGRLGFDGLIVTDALTMGALRRIPGYSPGELAVRAVEAGNDVVLGPPDMLQAHAAIVAAVRSGRLAEARIDASVRRILAAKARLGLHRERLVDPARVSEVVASPAHARTAEKLAHRSLVLARDAAELVPLDPREHPTVAAVAFSSPTDLQAGRAFFTELDRLFGEVWSVRLDEKADDAAYDEAVRRAAAADVVLLSTFWGPVSGQGHLDVPDRARELARRLTETGRPIVVVAFGDPYGPAALPGAGTLLLAWQPRGEAAQVAAARALAGQAPLTGTLPIELDGLPRGSGLRPAPLALGLQPATATEEVGMDEAALARIDGLIESAIAAGASPGAALAVGRQGALVRRRGYGRLDWREGFGPVTDSTLYDLASLTKVVGTTTAVMMLVEAGRLEIDAPLRQYVPEWGGSPEKDRVTIRDLLVHTAGLPAFAPLWRELRGKDAYVRHIGGMELEYEPGTKTIYSDLGLILLGEAVERAAGQPLDAFLRERVFEPLRMQDTGYNPLGGCLAPETAEAWATPDRIAPTEVDTLFRRTHVHGIVHDENACAMGGVAPHAGLFSSARDLAVFAQMLLNGGIYRGVRLIEPATLEAFTRRQGEASSRALGWDTPSEGSSAGRYFSERSFGHTGFTGTSLWIDPARSLFVVLLTNRVNPTRENQKHVPLRRAVHDAVQQAVTDEPVARRQEPE